MTDVNQSSKQPPKHTYSSLQPPDLLFLAHLAVVVGVGQGAVEPRPRRVPVRRTVHILLIDYRVGKVKWHQVWPGSGVRWMAGLSSLVQSNDYPIQSNPIWLIKQIGQLTIIQILLWRLGAGRGFEEQEMGNWLAGLLKVNLEVRLFRRM